MREYTVTDDESHQIYFIRIQSENEDDWVINVYGSDLTTLVETITPHDFIALVPERLRGQITSEISRGRRNIEADNIVKRKV